MKLYTILLTIIQKISTLKTSIAAKADKTAIPSITIGSRYAQIKNVMICWGEVSITPTANTPTAKQVTFSKAFSGVPVVTLTPNSAVPGTQITGAAVTNISKTGFIAYLTRTNATSSVAEWIAIGRA